MKKITVLAIILMIAFAKLTFAQVAISTDNSNAAPSSMLEVKSTTKGFLPPRMTEAQMHAIPSPEVGLEIFNLNTNSKWIYYSGDWHNTIQECPPPTPDPLNCYFLLDVGNVEIPNHGWATYYAVISGIGSQDAVFGSPQGNPNNGGNIIPNTWATTDTLWLKLTNTSNHKNNPKTLDYSICVKPLSFPTTSKPSGGALIRKETIFSGSGLSIPVTLLEVVGDSIPQK